MANSLDVLFEKQNHDLYQQKAIQLVIYKNNFSFKNNVLFLQN